jgi:hypothetical protein
VQLVQNFRSHPSILHFPNEKFYNSSLRPHGNPSVIYSYIGSPILPNLRFPIIFHALTGQDAREASSPSFFNILEAQQVKRYVEQLRFDRRGRIGMFAKSAVPDGILIRGGISGQRYRRDYSIPRTVPKDPSCAERRCG